jgi:RNA polymerase primary sigma factor
MMTTNSTDNRSLQSPLQTYLHEIGETFPLTADEERALAYRIEDGDAEARDHLVRANLRLVVNIARRYQRKGVDLPDLIAEGNLGLIRAAEGFDVSRNCRFSTYAVHWVKRSLRHAVVNMADGTLRLPVYMVQLLNEWRRATAKLYDELGRQATEEEVSCAMQLTPRQLWRIKKAIRIHNVMPQGAGQDGNDSVDDVVTKELSGRAESRSERSAEAQEVVQLMDKLDPRARAVLRLRFGLGGQETKTLREIGEGLDLTRERVRQIERDALNQLNEILVGD